MGRRGPSNEPLFSGRSFRPAIRLPPLRQKETVRCLAPIDSEIDWVERIVYHVKNFPSTVGSSLMRRFEKHITVSRDTKNANWIGAALAQGEREYMEDMAFAVSHVPVRVPNTWSHFWSPESLRGKPENEKECSPGRDKDGDDLNYRTTDVSFYSIMDGHNGETAALWTKKYLWNYVKSELKKGAHPRDALRSAFLRTDITFMAQATAQDPPDEAGAAVIALLVLDSEVYVAGAGDARAVLCNTGDKRPLSVSVTHRPDVPKEMARILSQGGFVTTVGSPRISGILSVSRGIGDLPHKKFLSAEPDVVHVKLREGDRYMVLGSDGVWDYLDDSEAARLVKSARTARVAAEMVSTSALFAGSDDNVGCLVVDLPLLFDKTPTKAQANATVNDGVPIAR